jgi:1-acyl-sn-glycerol-3-phosphate acyltransferase
MALADATPASYEALLAAGRAHYPGVRLGRPGRARTYWATVVAMRALRVRYKIDVDGAQHVPRGPAILVGNHVAFSDPLVVVMSSRWRVTAFTKIEWFESRAALFFRWMGQIPLRRGDQGATDWAIDMASSALARGGKVGLYPEGTRSPDPAKLHRLHGRVLIPVLRANPEVPTFAVTTTYRRLSVLRTHVRIRFSPPLPLHPLTMTSEAILSTVRDALLALGGQTYVDISAREVKANPR